MITPDKWSDFFNNPDTVKVLGLACLGDFKIYIKVMFYALNHKNFTFKPFHNMLISKLQDIVEGKNAKRNLMLNIPVGSGKSLIVEMFITWVFARNISAKFCYVSHSADLIAKLSNETKEIIYTKEWASMFGHELKRSERAKLEYSFEGGGSRSGLTGASMGGAITGVDAGNPNTGADFGGALIIDDPMDVGNANSETQKNETIRIYTDKLSTRLRSEKTPVILIMQRIAVDDLAAYVEKNEPDLWDIVKIPAISQDEKGNWSSIWPEKYPVEKMLKMAEINPTLFYSQYQQEPIISGGNLFKESMFVRGPMPSSFDFTFITVDTAYKEKQENDYTVAAAWGCRSFADGTKRVYLLDVFRERIKAADCEAYLVPFFRKWNTGNFVGALIEPKGHGIYLNQKMITYGLPMQSEEFIDEFFADRRMDKVARANVVIPTLNTFPVIVSDNISDSMFTALKEELLNFPKGAHDDACFTADTLIATSRGDVPIKDIRAGDKVITPFGLSKVEFSGCTGRKEVISKFGLTATPTHKVFNGNKFEKLNKIKYDVLLDRLTVRGLLKWQYKKLLCSMELNTDLWGRAGIILASQQQIKAGLVRKDFTQRFGSFIAGRKYRKAFAFTTKTVMCLITTLKIWSAYHALNILRNTAKNLLSVAKAPSTWSIWKKLGNLLASGTKARKAEQKQARFSKELQRASGKRTFALSVAELLQDVQLDLGENTGKCAINVMMQKATEKNGLKSVYNLKTTQGCYYANGVLVSNCDVLIDSIKFVYNRPLSILDVV